MPFFGVQVRDLTKDEGIEDQELQEVQVKSWMSGLDIKKAIRAAGVTSLPSRPRLRPHCMCRQLN